LERGREREKAGKSDTELERESWRERDCSPPNFTTTNKR